MNKVQTTILAVVVILVVLAIIQFGIWFLFDDNMAIGTVMSQSEPLGIQDDCAYFTTYVPLGYWVTNCDRGWYVTFWGGIY
ncbi:MAG: hypothetical protein A3A33_03670 [Candidatus Yanofskybacteria bacterium RIFCSPLOWO2_01_FULL_49_25]|uniref:Uncharacterized protein n=1 Tax=Candidatus Yanofskybacteria bacterium RIFCSPLOWO2_01_FULL_49_25 TaxID=1802701 RepID=A0A1F8GWC4_9BACT|nr:MAG: hypothetical protein A3A33_03670 [Candidatus Yanofskybacteria bacterium RIFCSPLOWO2_01_FULL_49_25]